MLNLRRVENLRRALDPVPELEGFDPVTGLAARDLMLQRLERQWKWCLKHEQPISLLMVNVDHYGAYRSVYGTRRAEDALARVAQAIADTCRRRADFAGRVRDDEFAVLLSDSPEHGAACVAENIRIRVAGPAGVKSGQPDPMTVSIGVATTIPSASRFVMSLIHDADVAMKQAKERGRNRVAVFADA